MLNFLVHWMGLDNGSGPIYLFWSGFGSIVVQPTMLVAILVYYRQHKCVTCLRIAYHPVDGTIYKTCHRHATVEHHANLVQRHGEEHPEQHKFLRRPKSK